MSGTTYLVEKNGPLVDWVLVQLNDLTHLTPSSSITLLPVGGDAGMRVYYRIKEHPGLIVAAAPITGHAGECVLTFTKVAKALKSSSISVPEVYAHDGERNFMLIEDLGDQLFADELSDETVDVLYGEALMTLLQIQQVSEQHALLPSYDRQALRTEMEFFNLWFVQNLLQYDMSDAEHAMVDKAFQFLEDQALSQPTVFVHRDYHSRNLLYRKAGVPGVIDFQDALWGPVTYDLVSLLRDCYVRWSPEQVRRWAIAYANMAIDVGIIPPVDEPTFMGWFDTMGLQRHIKVLGVFARLALRDNKPSYLQDISLVIRYVLEVSEHYPEMAEFLAWFESKLLPVINQTSWYRDHTVATGRSSELVDGIAV